MASKKPRWLAGVPGGIFDNFGWFGAAVVFPEQGHGEKELVEFDLRPISAVLEFGIPPVLD